MFSGDEIYGDEITSGPHYMGPRLWDADPTVCCAAFQLGACAHTEDLAEAQAADLEPQSTGGTDRNDRPEPRLRPGTQTCAYEAKPTSPAP
jgi:hypothetical protein